MIDNIGDVLRLILLENAILILPLIKLLLSIAQKVSKISDQIDSLPCNRERSVKDGKEKEVGKDRSAEVCKTQGILTQTT